MAKLSRTRPAELLDVSLLAGRALLVLAAFCLCAPAAALEFSARTKAFATGAALPSHDFQRELNGTPAYDYTADLRLMFRHSSGSLRWIADLSTTLNGGDSFAFNSAPGITLDQSPGDDDMRLMDLSWEIGDGDRHRVVQRFDRLAVEYRRGNWGLTLGRQAVSWGNGIVFQPMDLFSPFAPTTVDRDYKAGDDLLLVEMLLGNGSDLQLLAVARRDADGDVTGQADSVALKWHGYTGSTEFDLVAGKHYRDQVYGFSTRLPLGGALLRSDVIATRLADDSDWKISGIVNLDYSFAINEKTLYVYFEYFHNSFGVSELPVSPVLLPQPLLDRLGRGEVFNLMKDYVAGGSSVQWHPLWTQNLTVISNLHDASSLLQTQLTYEPGDHSRVQLGVVVPLGRAGDEFGGVPLLGAGVTSGGAKQGYLRWVYYF